MNLGNVNIDTLYDNAWMLYHSRDIPGDVDFEELHLAADIVAKVRTKKTALICDDYKVVSCDEIII